jgi:hypothetical protein
MGLEPMTSLYQRGPDATMVKEFAVENSLHTAVLIGNRLPAICQANDTQAPRSKTEAGILKKPILVRTAMLERLRHRLQKGMRDGASSTQIDHSSNAAHRNDGSFNR